MRVEETPNKKVSDQECLGEGATFLLTSRFPRITERMVLCRQRV